jgi:uncharacterized protein
MLLTIIFLCISAFVAGFIDSIAGGGGLISLPALLAAGIPSHIALGTNKLQSMCGTSFSVINYARKNKIIWKAALTGLPFALIGSWIGARTTLIIPSATLAKVLIFMLPPAVILMLASNALLNKKTDTTKCNSNMYLNISIVCLMIGAYDGFFGPGTGTFLIVLMVLLCKIPLINASATAKVFNLASNVGAVLSFMISGHIYYALAIAMAVSNIAGNLTGSSMAIKKGNPFIQKFVYIAIGILFIYLIWNNYIRA